MDHCQLLRRRLCAEHGRASDVRPEAEKMLREIAFVLQAARRVKASMQETRVGHDRP